MSYKPVGIDENGMLPPRAREAIAVSPEIATAIDEKIDGIPSGVSPTTPPLARIGKVATQPFRILFAGTSILETSTGYGYRLLAQLQKIYGATETFIGRAGILGGSWELAHMGWAKQYYGGPSFVRAVGLPASSPLTFNIFGDYARLEWSREIDGGVSEVLVDGVSVGTIGGAGAQAYSQVSEFSFPAGNHTIAINPPASGRTYLETYEFGTAVRSGIEAKYHALGGSALVNTRVVREPASGGSMLAPIPIEGNAGVDAWFDREDIDLAIVAWVVNDAGAGKASFTNHYQPALDRLVELSRSRGYPVMLVVEMGGHYAEPADSGHETFNLIRDYVLSKRAENHVTVVDWHEATILDDLDAYQGRYYSADFIHPTAAGHNVITTLASQTFGIEPPVGQNPGLTDSARQRSLRPGEGADKIATVSGVRTHFAQPSGVGVRVLATDNPSHRRAPYYRHVDAYTSTASIAARVTQIEGSSTSDKWGNYFTYTWQNIAMSNFLGSDRALLSFLVRGPAQFRADAGMRLYADGTLIPFTDAANSRTLVTASFEEPTMVALEVGADVANSYLSFTGILYDLGLAKSDVPLLQLH